MNLVVFDAAPSLICLLVSSMYLRKYEIVQYGTFLVHPYQLIKLNYFLAVSAGGGGVFWLISPLRWVAYLGWTLFEQLYFDWMFEQHNENIKFYLLFLTLTHPVELAQIAKKNPASNVYKFIHV